MNLLPRLRLVVPVAAGILVLAMLAAGCGDGEGGPAPETPENHAGALHVTLDEWSVSGEDGAPIHSVMAGHVTFEVHNEGETPHELVIIRTDLPADELPVADNKVDEEAAGH